MAPVNELCHLVNPLATSAHLSQSASSLDGVPRHLEASVRFETARLIQAAGIFLHLPQEIIAQSIILLYRFWVGPDGGSILDADPRDTAAASLYLAAKPSGHALSPRHVLTVFEFLRSLDGDYTGAAAGHVPADWRLSEGGYELRRQQLYDIESQILRTLGFQTHVALPYALAINYLQALDVFNDARAPLLAKRTFAHLNTALLSPQMLYLTHQPNALATASIYLAARETAVVLPDVEWWEVFDVDREELGFLVVALRSVKPFAEEEKSEYGPRGAPLTVNGLRAMLDQIVE